MASKVSELVFCKAEEKDHIPLLELMSKVLLAGDSLHAEKYTLAKWKWKYFQLPSNTAHIYLCKENDEILGYYHCPVYAGTMNGQKKNFAMVQDVGVSEAARGKGVFKKLADFANAELLKCGVNFIYTFPNEKSIHTFLKYNGYKKIETFSTFLLPIKSGQILASKFTFLKLHKPIGALADFVYKVKLAPKNNAYSVFKEEKLSEEMVQLFLQFNSKFKNTLTRDFAYMHWRFEKKTHGKAYFFTAKKANKLVALAVISIEELLGSKAAVVLDFACESPQAFAQLFTNVKRNAAQYFDEKPAFFFTSVSNSNNALFKASGFLKIPEKLNPRALHLLGKNVSENEKEVLAPESWNFTLSEWDVL